MPIRPGPASSFVRGPTGKRAHAYSHGHSKADQQATRASHRGVPANEEIAAVTSAFEPKNLFLSALPAAEQIRLRPHLAFHRLSQGLVLQEPEQRIEHVYFVESGMISLVAMMQDGAAIETATLGREAILGSLSALGNHTAGTRAIVQIDATAWRISVADFRSAVDQSPVLRKMALLSSELMLAQMQQTAACNALHTADRRLCRWIIQVRDRIDEDVIRLTHDFLAQMLAVRRPTVSLIAYGLQQAGLIRYQRGKIAILDRAGLERGACECVGVLREKTRRIIGGVA
ncbi:MAG: Crp/Fnr family transcriptional regulator [Reyranella sp.]|nr:MAG: Crp/Fnr family transcriptional regulator [Reyranella sp.]TBR27561.1 MAG: Crp/Fnr family transcriptional regulator [Reyranella sp.]